MFRLIKPSPGLFVFENINLWKPTSYFTYYQV